MATRQSLSYILPTICKSTFTLSFAVEVFVPDQSWDDFKDGWMELPDQPINGLKLQYYLNQGQSFDIEIAIYPQCAKVLTSTDHCWVRTWQFLERRWLAFSISHAIAVRVREYINYEAIIEPTFGLHVLSARGKEKPQDVYFQPLTFGVPRYFQEVLEFIPTAREKLFGVIKDMIWNLVEPHIPASYLDASFDVPYVPNDVRHRDAIISQVQSIILKSPEVENSERKLKSVTRVADYKVAKSKSTKLDTKPQGLKLSGDFILAGAGRITAFRSNNVGGKVPEQGNIAALISTGNLPAQDDFPIVFVNISTLLNAPIDEFRKLRVTHLYTRWRLKDEVHDSKLVDITSKTTDDEIQFDDHHVVPLNPNQATLISASYLDGHYKIELRGIRTPAEVVAQPSFFGYDKSDRDYGASPKMPFSKAEDLDFIIANTRMDCRKSAIGISVFYEGEYSLYPPQQSVETLPREALCTNDINMIRMPLTPNLLIPASTVLLSHMTLGVAMGLVGCRPRRLVSCYSRMFCHVKDPETVMAIITRIRDINVEMTDHPETRLTGFALDTGDVVIMFIEGERDGHILKIWDMTADFYPKINPVFSSKTRYSTRIYPELIHTIVPFILLKTRAPLSCLLACPPLYARPALPVPARIALMKIGALVQMRQRAIVLNTSLPTAVELASFRLELCASPRNTDWDVPLGIQS